MHLLSRVSLSCVAFTFTPHIVITGRCDTSVLGSKKLYNVVMCSVTVRSPHDNLTRRARFQTVLVVFFISLTVTLERVRPRTTIEAIAAAAMDMAASGCALPVVDLTAFFTGDKGGIARAAKAVAEACRTHGFFRAINHGVPAELTARALDLSAAFFALPDDEKPKVRPAEGFTTPIAAGYGRQPAHSADKNEYLLFFHPKLGINVYPDGFRSVLGAKLCSR